MQEIENETSVQNEKKDMKSLADNIHSILEEALELLNQRINTAKANGAKLEIEREIIKNTVESHSENLIDSFFSDDDEAVDSILNHMFFEAIACKFIKNELKTEYEELLNNKIEPKLAIHAIAKLIENQNEQMVMEKELENQLKVSLPYIR
jgi:hypothetical protein